MHPDEHPLHLATDEHRADAVDLSTLDEMPGLTVALIHVGGAIAAWVLIGGALAIGWWGAGKLMEVGL